MGREVVLAGLADADRDVRLAAILAASRLNGDAAAWRDPLDSVLRQAARRNDAGEVIACLEALTELNASNVVNILARTALEADSAFLRLQAARCLIRASADLGGRAMLGLFAEDDPAIRSLAAFWLAKAGHSATEALVEQVRDYDDRRKCAGLLALGWRRESIDDPTILELLGFARDSRIKAHVRMYRMMMGLDAPDHWGDLLAVEGVDPPAVHAVMLEAGAADSLEVLLGDQAEVRYDLMGVFRGLRFIEVLSYYLPDAPAFEWFEDSGLCEWQISRLRQWHRIAGKRLAFDARKRIYRPRPAPGAY